MSKPLADLLQGFPFHVNGSTDVHIEDVVFDSRQVRPGALFVVFQGAKQDARQFIPAAIAAGARAIMTSVPVDANGVTTIQTPDLLAALAQVSLRFWDYPSRKLLTVGVTGTNGKTTSTYLIESILNAAALKPGVLGTINYRFDGHGVPAPNTTPFPSDIQRFMARVASAGGQACVMEVSSHALALGRVAGIEFDVAIFTNLTQDHLDFHKTMEAYLAAKLLLFSSLDPASSTKSYPKCAVVNVDDPAAPQVMAVAKVPVMRFALHHEADVFAKSVQSDATGSRFELHHPKGHFPVSLKLPGDYNISNALAAAAAALAEGVDPTIVQRGLQTVTNVPGRMERFAAASGFSVVVDYAHTDDALRHVLEALRRLKPTRLITVFGCGGDRDRTKRPLMGEVAAQLSDEVIVTSDNPRSEDPSRITLDIEVGVRRVRSDHYEIIVDREQAIAKALSVAQRGDIVLVAGKGHENYQIIGSQTFPFDDREVVKRYLSKESAS